MGIGAAGRQIFDSLSNRNYRLYFAGQSTSLIGTWMQTVAQSWLVLELTGSGTALGIVVALQMSPMLLVGPYAGVIADRVNKRLLLCGLQSAMGVLAVLLGMLCILGVVRLWHVYVLALLLGLCACFETPTRQAFMLELVGPEHLRNAVSLNSTMVNVARAVGPAVGGVVIALAGVGTCFFVNAASFIAVVISLLRLDTTALSPVRAERGPGQVRDGFAYVLRTPGLRTPLLMVATVSCLAYQFPVVFPLLASQTFGGDARTYGFMTAAVGSGAVVGGLYVAGWGRTGVKAISFASAAFGIAMICAAVAPILWVELIALTWVGVCLINVIARGNSTVQLAAEPHMRGRVMALWAVAVLGSAPIGGPIVGVVSHNWGARTGLLLGAASCFIAALVGLAALRRRRNLDA